MFDRFCALPLLQQKAEHRVVVVLPAYNCARTLKQTVMDIPQEYVDDIVLVDDASTDETMDVAKTLNIKHIKKQDIHNKV